MGKQLPFIYICSLPRTGSTMLSEALMQLPYAYILHEPHFGKNAFAVHRPDADALLPLGIDLERFARFRRPVAFGLRRLRWMGYPQDYMMRELKERLLPQFRSRGIQFGVKEIKHMGWQNYVRHFPEMKVIVLGRDPRDFYLSYYRLWQKGVIGWRGPFNPETAAIFLKREFAFQVEIQKATDAMRLSYERLCTVPEALEEAKVFVESQVSDGEIGSIVAAQPARRDEHLKHGGRITTLSVQKWTREQDERLLEQALQFFDLVPEYAEYWGYVE